MFAFRYAIHLVAIANPKQTQSSKDKENIGTNNDLPVNYQRAILAVSEVQKVQMPKPSSSILKNVLKKSVSVPPPAPSSSAAQHSEIPVKVKRCQEVKPASAVIISQKIIKKPPPVAIGQRQYEYAEAMRKRKEQLVQKLKAQEDKELKFHFHANPAPKFKKPPVKQQSVDVKKRPAFVKQNSLPHIPMTKTVSKEFIQMVPSCGDPERLKSQKEKRERLLAKYQEAPVLFKAKPAAILKKQPFQPVHNPAKIVDSKPFKLHLTERLMMRSEYDKKLTETNAYRKKQDDSRQRSQDLKEKKLIRQKTEFKARANPFRSYQ